MEESAEQVVLRVTGWLSSVKVALLEEEGAAWLDSARRLARAGLVS